VKAISGNEKIPYLSVSGDRQTAGLLLREQCIAGIQPFEASEVVQNGNLVCIRPAGKPQTIFSGRDTLA
jgi:hypothetical protein